PPPTLSSMLTLLSNPPRKSQNPPPDFFFPPSPFGGFSPNPPIELSGYLGYRTFSEKVARSGDHEHGAGGDGNSAGLFGAGQVQLDAALVGFFVGAGHGGVKGEGVAGEHRLLPADAHAADVFGAEPFGGPRRQRAGLEQADGERGRVTGGAGE